MSEPELVLGARLDIIEEIRIVLDRVTVEAPVLRAEGHVVRMGLDQRHAALFGDPIQFSAPDGVIFLTEQDENREVLRDSIRQFRKARPGAVRRLNPAGEDPTKAAGLRLKGVDVVGGNGIIDVQVADPGQVVEHGARTEASSLPLREEFIDAWKPLFKYFPTAIEPAVMIQVVDEHLEAPLHERAAQSLRSLVTERNEAKGRAEPTILLHVRQLLAM